MGTGLSMSLFNPPPCPSKPTLPQPQGAWGQLPALPRLRFPPRLAPASVIPGAQRTLSLGEPLGPDARAGRVCSVPCYGSTTIFFSSACGGKRTLLITVSSSSSASWACSTVAPSGSATTTCFSRR